MNKTELVNFLSFLSSFSLSFFSPFRFVLTRFASFFFYFHSSTNGRVRSVDNNRETEKSGKAKYENATKCVHASPAGIILIVNVCSPAKERINARVSEWVSSLLWFFFYRKLTHIFENILQWFRCLFVYSLQTKRKRSMYKMIRSKFFGKMSFELVNVMFKFLRA